MVRLALTSLRASARALMARPTYAGFAIATLALAIGANTVMFSVVDGVLLKPLPYASSERLVTLDVRAATGFEISTSLPNYRDFRDRARSFDAFGGSNGFNMVLTGVDRPEVIEAQAVLGDFFGVLGMEAAIGRVLSAQEAPDHAGGSTEVVLGHGFWRDRFNADPAVIGRSLTLGGRSYSIAGVLPAGMGYPHPQVQVYYAMGTQPGVPWDERDSASGTRAVARLAAGVGLDQARDDLLRVGRELRTELGPSADVPELRTLAESLLGDTDRSLWLLLGAVGLVLAIALANLGSLVLARGEERQREIGIRAALGAGPRTLSALLLGEALLLAFLGGALGICLAWGVLQGILPLLPADLPAILRQQVAVDGRAAGFGMGLALLSGLAFGLLPAWRAARRGVLVSGARGVAGDRGRLRATLVAGEIALALTLLVGAGLTLKSLARVNAVDTGFSADRLLTFGVAASRDRVDSVPRWEQYHAELRDRLAQLPGVSAAALALVVPLSDRSWELRVHPEGVPVQDDTADSVLYNIVSPEYFDVLGIRLLRGRGFLPGDREGTQPVTVIDERMAERFWPGQDPIGRRITLDERAADGSPRYRTVVGLARSVRHYDITEPSRIQAYVPMAQTGRSSGPGLRVVLRTEVDPESVLGALRDAVSAHDAGAPVYAVQTLRGFFDAKTARREALAALLGVFASAALALAAMGVFGVVSYTVAQRAREIAIRVALGSSRLGVLHWIGVRVAGITGLGLGLGIVGALAGAGALRHLLYEVQPFDPGVLLGVVGSLALVSMLAACLAARRAARIEPARLLST